MSSHGVLRRAMIRFLAAAMVVAIGLMPVVAQADSEGGFYQQTNLVSDQAGVAKTQDANLVNAWGLSHSPTSPWWVSDNGAGVTTLYSGNGTIVPLVVTIPTPPGGAPPSAPTGQVFNNVNTTHPNDFVVSENGKSGPSMFMFATEDGTIAGWNSSVDRTNAILAVDRSGSGAVYKGLATGEFRGFNFIYATNFHAGTVEMFDARFHMVRSFTDRRLAADCPLPGQCYAPFGIQNIGGQLFVTFALQDADKHDDVKGAGHGFVDVFNTNGVLVRRFAAHGPLDSPWGLALAPAGFGRFSGDLLVGNFGDGRISAYDRHSGRFMGQLNDQAGHPITIDGLWGLAFGNGAQAGAANDLFFTAGPNGEQNGLFGMLHAMSSER